jgi:acetolactate synthase I/II/III large subunit
MDAQPNRTVAEAYLEALYKHGIRHVFANGGTDFAPIVEGLLRSHDAVRAVPRFVTVPHENVAMSMAAGYYRIARTPACVMVHVTVATANALCGVMNADRGNIPVLLAAGRSPATETGDTGSRNIGIHWSQENFDQGGMLREYVRWDYELRAGQPVNTIVGRALDIAMTDPKGPVYLTLPREILGDVVVDPGPAPRSRPKGTLAAAPSETAIEQAADMIAAGARTLIIGGSSESGGFNALAELAETHGIACAPGMGAYLPTSHGMNLGAPSQALFDWADVVIILDSAVPWIPRFGGPKPTAKLIHIATDPHFSRYPHRGYEMDLAISGSVDLALPLLNDALKLKLKDRMSRVDARRREIGEMRQTLLDRRAKALERAKSAAPISAAWIAACIDDAKDRDAIFFNELGVPPGFMTFDFPGCSMAGGGSAGGSAVRSAVPSAQKSPRRSDR